MTPKFENEGFDIPLSEDNPLPNASPTPGPGKVCEKCGGKKYIYVQANQGPGSGLSVRTLCPRCQGSGLEGE